MNVTPSRSASAFDPPTPRFFVPLLPAPMPSTARPPLSTSIEAIAAAVVAGWREVRLVTHSATCGCFVCSASSAALTHGSIALPGVSATPIMSKP